MCVGREFSKGWGVEWVTVRCWECLVFVEFGGGRLVGGGVGAGGWELPAERIQLYYAEGGKWMMVMEMSIIMILTWNARARYVVFDKYNNEFTDADNAEQRS